MVKFPKQMPVKGVDIGHGTEYRGEVTYICSRIVGLWLMGRGMRERCRAAKRSARSFKSSRYSRYIERGRRELGCASLTEV